MKKPKSEYELSIELLECVKRKINMQERFRVCFGDFCCWSGKANYNSGHEKTSFAELELHAKRLEEIKHNQIWDD